MGRASAWKPHKVFTEGKESIHYPINDQTQKVFESETDFLNWMVHKWIWAHDHIGQLGQTEDEYLIKEITRVCRVDRKTAKNYIDAEFKEQLPKAIAEKQQKRVASGRLEGELPNFQDLDVVRDYMEKSKRNITLIKVLKEQAHLYEFSRKHPFDWNISDYEEYLKACHPTTNRKTLFAVGSCIRRLVEWIINHSAKYGSEGRQFRLTQEQLSSLQNFLDHTKTYKNPVKESFEKGATEKESYSWDEVVAMLGDIDQMRADEKFNQAEAIELEFLVRFLYSSGARIGSQATKLVRATIDGEGWKAHWNPCGALNIRWEWVDWEGKDTALGTPSITMYDKGKRMTEVQWIDASGVRKSEMWKCHKWLVGFTDKTFECLKTLRNLYYSGGELPRHGLIFRALGYKRAMALMKTLIARLIEREMRKQLNIPFDSYGNLGKAEFHKQLGQRIDDKLQDLKEFHGLRKALVRYLVDVMDWHEEWIIAYTGVSWEDIKTLHDFYFPRYKIMEKLRGKLVELKGMI